ncbi:cytochrome p450 [Paramarasmius palmivorus]|uniref:Cytochrome p450 n=1 Tax=Paramarasmius palmivorus TaxID=297713 RepID=A0AAW0CCB8_9AGAR
MFPWTALAFTLLACLALAATKRIRRSQRGRKGLRYPPGPPGGVITGNIFDIPHKKPWDNYTRWAKRYGAIIHLEMLGDHIIILNDVDVANELLEKRSRIYSSRPYSDIAEVSGWGFNIAFMPYVDTWRKQRRTFQQHLRPAAVVEIRPLIQRCMNIFLNNLLRAPDDFMGHIDLLSCSLALMSMYGITIRSPKDPLLSLAKATVHTLDTVWSTPFTFVMKYFPFVRFIPGWVPVLGGIGRYITSTRELCRDMRELPWKQVIEELETGTDNEGVVARMLQKENVPAEELERIKDMATMTLSSIGTFFMAMAKSPQFQEKAQRELDAVIGSGRLPSHDDRKSLPYIEAIYRETMRWHPGVVHSATEDDTYNGYYLPKGSMVFANIWAMTRDERVYTDPKCFNPERFFNADGTLNGDDTVLAFGFGRRICVGKHFAEATVWLTIASVLSCFKISLPKDAQGNEVDIPERFSEVSSQLDALQRLRCCKVTHFRESLRTAAGSSACIRGPSIRPFDRIDVTMGYVIVIGAGVVGLTTAIKVQEGSGHRVAIIAETFPTDPKNINYTSHWAGAQHVFAESAPPDSQLHKIELETFEIMWELSSPGSPTEKCFKRCTDKTYYGEPRPKPHPFEFYPDFRYLDKEELISGSVEGVSFTTVTIDVPVYLNYLLARFCGNGGTLTRGRVDHIAQVVEGGIGMFGATSSMPPDAIIVCNGLGARSLGGVEDKTMFPIRGQTVLLRAPWFSYMPVLYVSGKDQLPYAIPRRSGDVIVGGTFHANDWYPKPRPEITRTILEEAIAVYPELAPPEARRERTPTIDDLLPIVIEEGVGLRPGREQDIRLEVEQVKTVLNDKGIPVVYNYGHGGRGFQSSWGSASVAAELLEGALNPK